jgi:ABC-type dipeptide/oligopeptide/nickel transport system ATPase component
MCQRAALAIAMAPGPDVLVADEATSALDPTIQLQIVDLLRSLSRHMGLTLILITHDMGLVGYLCDDVVVMQSGAVVESGAAAQVLTTPNHSYTKLLMSGV